jgi:hypothetical protein
MIASTAVVYRSGNGLALLANKCAARTFDISTGMVYASIRDQIVRAQLLIRDLKTSDPQCRKILIVGAGVAGITAAACASQFGIEAVVLETGDKPFQLQSAASNRRVGPFMYEWPSIVSEFQNYPNDDSGLCEALESTPTWTADSPHMASDLADVLSRWLRGRTFQEPVPRFFFGVAAEVARKYVKEFVTCVSKQQTDGSKDGVPALELPADFVALDGQRINGKSGTYLPDYVVLAVGMGTERVFLIDNEPNGVKGVPFWSQDDLRANCRMDWEVGVFGGGDGALQDVLRLVTKHDHPLTFIDSLEKGADSIKAKLNALRSTLEVLEQQSRLLASWSSGPVYDLIDSRCRELCKELSSLPRVADKVMSQMRLGNGIVYHVYKEGQFGRAYLLNRFCVHLIHACLQEKKAIGGKVRYVRLSSTLVRSASEHLGTFKVALDNGQILNLDRVVVRYGPNRDEQERSQLVKISAETKADRMSMSAIPLPFVVAR